jgi:lon-related putative ATP-dependent protease
MARKPSLKVKPRDARWLCNPARFDFETTDDVPCCVDIIGQERAIKAIKLGLEVHNPGYNIYVSGLTGTGRSTTITRLLKSMELEKKELLDICYVHNFKMTEMPACITLPAGKGARFKKAMGHMYETLKTHVPQVFEGEKFKTEQKKILDDFKEKKNGIVSEFETIIADKGFSLFEVQYGPFTRPEIMPVIENEAVSMDKLAALLKEGKITEERVSQIEKDRDALMEKMDAFVKQSRLMDMALAETMLELEKKSVSPLVQMCVREVHDKFCYDKVRTYLKNLEDYIIENIAIFKEAPASEQEQRSPRDAALEFEVNVIVDNSTTQGLPVIIETVPRYTNLFGTIERSYDGREEGRTDFTKIRAGSMIRANGGFLILNLTDIVEEPTVWPALKRALKNEQVTIQSFDSFFFMPFSALKPEPIHLDVKVVLLGDAYSYQMLYNYDEEFKKIFKVKADFDNVMPNNEKNLFKYAQFIRNLSDEEQLRPFHKSAVAAVIEEGTRIAGQKSKLSTMFSDIADIIREADYWAEKEEFSIVERRHVEKALAERIHRVSLIEDKIKELIHDGVILLDVAGTKVGQINGLSVYDMGDYSFGKPSRITAETALGRAGVINIEREADMSGKTHNKGVLILEGYLRRQYAQDKPLTMSASLCFEQSYSGIDGDSASSTEIYVLLSSLAGVPLRQDLAVTGSVNQKGEIQPIGGVNEKIEGFYDVCKVSGLTGTQGVLIPSLNKRDLMLRKNVVEAIRNGTFHVYAIRTIDEGIELLTGVKAGKRLKNGMFEKDSVHRLVDDRLREFAERIKEFFNAED